MTRMTLLAGLVLLSACSEIDQLEDTRIEALTAEQEQTACLLTFVNDADTTVAYLDDIVGIGRHAAKNLVNHRTGSDRVTGTFDDNLFDDVSEVQTISHIGDTAFDAIAGHADRWCAGIETAQVDGVYDGIAFTRGQAEHALTIVNTASEIELIELFDGRTDTVDTVLVSRELLSLYELAGLTNVDRKQMRALRSAAMRRK